MNQSENSPSWASLLHLSQLSSFVVPLPYIGIIAPILIWQFTRSRHPHLDRHGENAINWIISSSIYTMIALISVIGMALLPLLWGLTLVFPIIAAIKAKEGKAWKYPLTINFIGGRLPRQRLLATALALLILTLPAILGLGGMAFWANHRSSWLETTITTPGSVVEMKEETDSEGTTLYQPVIEFRDRAGETHKFSPSWSSSSPSYEKGETVTVLYPPDNPNAVIVDNWWAKWGVISILGIIAAIVFICSFLPSAICLILWAYWRD